MLETRIAKFFSQFINTQLHNKGLLFVFDKVALSAVYISVSA